MGTDEGTDEAAIYFPLYLVLAERGSKRSSVWYLPADLQPPSMYVPRKALSDKAVRAGWQSFLYDLRTVKDAFVRLA
jgi:type II restriction enzyme